MDTIHSIDIEAGSSAVYDLLARAEYWPELLAPTLRVEYLHRSTDSEMLRIWARAGDDVKSWTSVRELDDAAGRIVFRQTAPAAPIAAMTGVWTVRPVSAERTTLVLEHSFSAADDDPHTLQWIERVTDENSRTELAGLKTLAERLSGAAEVRTFSDSIRIAADPKAVHEFIWDAQRWTDELPHVQAIDIREFEEGIHALTMTTRSSVGVHDTMSIRITDGHSRIEYKQLTLPPLLDLHLGSWTIDATGADTVLTSSHTIRLRPEHATAELQQANLDKARNALSDNSMSTMRIARQRLGSGAR
ncbi:putative polyketide synthase bifunctional cyclase/dehydratase [Nocardia nova SH22a]|uniref:Putative polyketide synthase bifunctional cyclase/dehydratase n=1 Tax=Nocardia nova SH22a TaxID=1415166 RepID=W5T9V6_9NOCA|nr:SRPBCC family protein [Nocardia nova]AHH15884.1 putative polyketide synthase bifunctional cyclase/dehydratase [Nocardia nova SH22a]